MSRSTATVNNGGWGIIALGLSLLALGMHLEFRDSVETKVRAAMSEYQRDLAELTVIAKDARTTAKVVEREHLEHLAKEK